MLIEGLLAVSGVLCPVQSECPQTLPWEEPLAIVGGTLWDGTGAPPVPDAVVLVRDGLVACAGSRNECDPEGARLLDAAGRWLIPGLIDAHIHWQIWYEDFGSLSLSGETAARAARVYLANGITTVVDVGGQRWVPPAVREVLQGVAAAGPAPRMLFSGWIDRRTVDASEQGDAGALARELLGTGVDGIKIRSGLSVDEYRAIVSEADAFGRPVYGHTYYGGDREFIDHTAEAVALGVDGVFHVLGIPPVAPGVEPPLPSVPMDDWQAWWVAGANLWSYATDESMDGLIGAMVRSGAWLQPTLVTEQGLIDPDYFRDHPSWAHSPMTREELAFGSPVLEGTELAQYRAAYRQMQRFVGRYHAAGGMLVAGTDGVPVPGFGLQEELRLLVEAGVPAEAALQSATRNAAIAWKWQDRIGTIEAGRAADLLVLEGDPLADIGQTARIWRVVSSGVAYDPADLLSGPEAPESP